MISEWRVMGCTRRSDQTCCYVTRRETDCRWDNITTMIGHGADMRQTDANVNRNLASRHGCT